MKMTNMALSRIVKMTGCQRPCSYKEYKFVNMNRVSQFAAWPRCILQQDHLEMNHVRKRKTAKKGKIDDMPLLGAAANDT